MVTLKIVVHSILSTFHWHASQAVYERSCHIWACYHHSRGSTTLSFMSLGTIGLYLVFMGHESLQTYMSVVLGAGLVTASIT